MKNNLKRILKILVVIIIILLLLFGCSKLKRLEETSTTVEKVNVFDINVNVNYIQYILDENGNIIGKQEGTEPFEDGNIISGDNINTGNQDGNGKDPGTNGNNNGQNNEMNGNNNGQNISPNGENVNNGDNTSADGSGSGDSTGSGDNSVTELPSGEIQVRDKGGYEIPIYDPDRDKDFSGKLYVDDKSGDYIYQQHLDIFNDSMYGNRNMIAPGSNNIYHFTVHNSSNRDATYRIEMSDQFEYPVNMKYRLKKQNRYVIGGENEWVNADEIKTKYTNLLKGRQDDYYLEWKWFDDDVNDTITGSNMTSSYQLNVRVFFSVDDK